MSSNGRFRAVFAGIALLVLIPLQSESLALDLAPLFRTQTNDEAVREWQALGPLFGREIEAIAGTGDVQVTFARPVFSHFKGDESLTDGYDLLWPLGFSRLRKNGNTHFFFPLLHSRQKTDDPDSRGGVERWWLIPVMFHGQNREGTPYTALFPIGGTIRDIFGLDTVRFAAFPLYLSTQDGAIESQAVLWPIFSRTKGPEIAKWRIFPVYGTARTPQKDQSFILWPFVHLISLHDPNGLSGGGFFILPFFGRLTARNDDQEIVASSWTALWPFFSFQQTPQSRKLNAPWPLVQIADSETAGGTRKKRVFWPFFGRTRRDAGSYSFAAWPFVHWWDDTGPASDAHAGTRMIVPIYYSRKTSRHGKIETNSLRIWPLLRYQRVGDKTRMRAPALWPLREVRPIARNYAPLWQIYTYDREENDKRFELLWGLCRYESDEAGTEFVANPLFSVERQPGATEVSFLKGLFGISHRKTEGTTGRLLWLLRW